MNRFLGYTCSHRGRHNVTETVGIFSTLISDPIYRVINRNNSLLKYWQWKLIPPKLKFSRVAWPSHCRTLLTRLKQSTSKTNRNAYLGVADKLPAKLAKTGGDKNANRIRIPRRTIHFVHDGCEKTNNIPFLYIGAAPELRSFSIIKIYEDIGLEVRETRIKRMEQSKYLVVRIQKLLIVVRRICTQEPGHWGARVDTAA